MEGMAQCTRHSRLLSVTLLLLSCSLLRAQSPPSARFDLTGPKIEVQVTRAGQTLPIASVPNLQAGDQLRLHPDLPRTQSVRYLLVAVFLRGTTNPPPDNWFFRIQTWDKKVREEGVTITVPEEAQQAILFLAPETGGDFSTLRSAVRGRPGVFVRASQDLAEAGFEQARIEKYVAQIRLVAPSDPKALAEHSTLLARTLNLRPNDECFRRPADTQYTCLTQSGSQTLLDDGHGQTVVASLTSGANTDFINAASATSLAGGGTYSAYVGAVVDLVKIMGALHTAQYQYIPAIAFPQDASLNLRLNTPPSFHNPKSVIVIGLPAIQPSTAPPLRPTDPKLVACLLKPNLVLPVEGAPLVFSTAFAHDLTLHLNRPGPPTDIPLTADAFQGGLVLSFGHAQAGAPHGLSTPSDRVPLKSTAAPPPAVSSIPGAVSGTVTGFWGFDAFTGPTLQLQDTPGKDWKVAADDPLIAGRENHLLITSSGSGCIQKITLEAVPGKETEASWKATDKPNVVSVDLPLKSSDPGSLHLSIHQYAEKQPAIVAAKTFSEPATLASLQIHVGDTFAILSGTSLDQVQHMSLGDLVYTPVSAAALPPDAEATPAQPGKTAAAGILHLSLPAGATPPRLKPGDDMAATVSLKDGRVLPLPVTILGARPQVTLISKSIPRSTDSSIHLASEDDLPVSQQLVFSLRSPAAFPRAGKIEVANADDTLRTSLTVAAGTLVLQDPHTLLGTLDPLKTFGTSAFGPLRLRAVAPDGTPGDWIPLAVLVRLPTLTDIHCTSDAAAACTLTGTSLYLVDSVGNDSELSNPTNVPAGFVGTSISVPRPSAIAAGRPANTTLYVRLRDDPSSSNSVVLPVLPQQ
ncbi:MAG: hypothetical protein NVSMB3_06050 [Acidobacteriaceae bacterium]